MHDRPYRKYQALTSRRIAATLAAGTVLAVGIAVAQVDGGRTQVEHVARRIADELSASCPRSAPGDQAAYDTCRAAMYRNATLRSTLLPVTLWGRTHREPDRALKHTNLTQFAPDVLTGLYLPLFMFTGAHRVTYEEREKLWRIELGATFRNRLQPGQFPYPFWHEDEKWTTYNNANAILVWIDPSTFKAKIIQFTPRGSLEPAVVDTPATPPAFDGKWMWTDNAGQQQPKVTLFDGLFAADNPYLPRLDSSYRALALTLREGQCMDCHVPSNPDRMSRLVILQTPAHAAGEIHRVLKAVREDRMPLDDATHIEQPLDPARKNALLATGDAFAADIEAANAWEQSRRGSQIPSAGTSSMPPWPAQQR